MHKPLLVKSSLFLLGLFCLGVGSPARADEGMWLFNQPPRELLKEKYQFDLTEEWLEKVQKASIRFNSGGSGSFVSPRGLVVTNHHIGAGTLQKLSTKEKNYYRDGFYAKTMKEELKCPDLELNVLESIEDVTEKVLSAVKPGMSDAEAAAARRAVISRIESDSLKKTGLRSDVISLYQGGLFHLYRYKKYTDVRLVMAPEEAIAFFGGDTDNFEYPRYNLDVCFFRVYENGKPLSVEHHFPWSTKGPKEGDLVFVSGNPGSTNRLETLARLEHRRDETLPFILNLLRHREALLQQYSALSPEKGRIAKGDLYRSANARKAYTGQFLSLLNPEIMKQKADQENRLKKKIHAHPELAKKVGNPWKTIAAAQNQLTNFEEEYHLFERGYGFYSKYFPLARHLVRLAKEKQKPNEKRLPAYRESAWDSLKLQLFSPAPIYPDLEQAKLAGSLAFCAEILGGDHPLVKRILAGKPPEERAAELVQNTRLGNVAARKQLVEEGQKGIETSQDAMIQLALLVDAYSRNLRKRYEEQIEEPQQQAYAKIAKARFQLLGQTKPPDATFTLRLAFGVVKGYSLPGQKIPFQTTFAGAYQRAQEQLHHEPFAMPNSRMDIKDQINLDTPFNFVSTADTIGGNSGSPVINRAAELVGINFDRNRQGLVRNYVYTDYQARHVSVHCLAVLEALRNIYEADRLAEELVGKN